MRKILEDASRGSRYIIASRSHPKAALIGIEELETLEVMADRDLLAEIREAKDDIRAGRYVPYAEFLRKR
jgi:prevent-host-death family protein